MQIPSSVVRHRLVLGSTAVLAAVVGWYFFRPERAFIDAAVSEAAPAAHVTVLAEGSFVPGEHEGAGTATVVRLEDGTMVLRFSSFRTLNGPDLRVYLLGAADVQSGAQLRSAGYLDLGFLKGNVGDQNYVLPPGTDLSKYRAVSVWCRRFGVNFTTAVLAGGDSSAVTRG
jgi:hypothetical protein